jgi:hypothetical protein
VSNDIQEHIIALHERLDRIAPQKIDARTRELLLMLLSDLTRLLGPPPLDSEDHPLTERLEELAVRFDAEHPSVSTAVRQLIDALAQAGI